MLLVAVALVVGAAAAWLAGRRPGAGGVAWRAPALVPTGAVLTLTGGRWLGGAAGEAVMAAGYAALIAFAALNARRPGLAMVGVGLLANLAVILSDGGMPVGGEPAGVPLGGQHHGLNSDDHLSAMSDSIRLSPLGERVSPGDLVAAAGGALAVFFWLEPSTDRPDRRRRAPTRIRPSGPGRA